MGGAATSMTSVPINLSMCSYHHRCHEPAPDQSKLNRHDPNPHAISLAPASAPPAMFPRHNGARSWSQGVPDMLETRYDCLRPLTEMQDVSPIYRHNQLLHPPMGASRHVREKIEWRPAVGEHPSLYQVARGAEDAYIFPLGPADSPHYKPFSRQEKEFALTHNADGERRRFRRGHAEPALKRINISDALHH